MAKFAWNAGCPGPCREGPPPIYPCLIGPNSLTLGGASDWTILSGSGVTFSAGTITVASGNNVKLRYNHQAEALIGRNVQMTLSSGTIRSTSTSDRLKLWICANSTLTSGYSLEVSGSGSTNLTLSDGTTSDVNNQGAWWGNGIGIAANDGLTDWVFSPHLVGYCMSDGTTSQSWFLTNYGSFLNPVAAPGSYVGLEIDAVSTAITVSADLSSGYWLQQTKNVSGPTCLYPLAAPGCVDIFATQDGPCAEYTVPTYYSVTIPNPTFGPPICSSYAGTYILTNNGVPSNPCKWYHNSDVGGGEFITLNAHYQNENRFRLHMNTTSGYWSSWEQTGLTLNQACHISTATRSATQYAAGPGLGCQYPNATAVPIP